MEARAVERRTDGSVVVSRGVGGSACGRRRPDVVDASWVLDKEEGDHEAWRAFEFGNGVKLSSLLPRSPSWRRCARPGAGASSVVVKEMAVPVDDDTASDDERGSGTRWP